MTADTTPKCGTAGMSVVLTADFALNGRHGCGTDAESRAERQIVHAAELVLDIILI